MAEGDEMVQNREVSVNWLRINVPQIAAILSVGMGLAWYSGDKIASLENRLQSLEQTRDRRSDQIDKNFDQIQQQLQPVANLPYRVGVLEQGLMATNQRMDQFLQSLGTKIDGVGDRVNSMSTKMEVLSQKIDSITTQKRSELGATPELVR